MSSLGRMEHESVQRREAKRCKEDGAHPFARCYWMAGDYDTPDQFICGRCWTILRTRPHGTPSLPAVTRSFRLYPRALHDEPPPRL
jgi:hypothetical protein